jgi:hypothetical protein
MAKKLRMETLRMKRGCGNCGRIQGAPECALCEDDTRLKSCWIPHPGLLKECWVCGGTWFARDPNVEPLCCPHCHSRRWNREKKTPGPKKKPEGGEDERRGDNPAGNNGVPQQPSG